MYEEVACTIRGEAVRFGVEMSPARGMTICSFYDRQEDVERLSQDMKLTESQRGLEWWDKMAPVRLDSPAGIPQGGSGTSRRERRAERSFLRTWVLVTTTKDQDLGRCRSREAGAQWRHAGQKPGRKSPPCSGPRFVATPRLGACSMTHNLEW